MTAENGDQPQVTVERNRYGYEVDGEFLRRVTTHLNGIPKPWLGGWAAKEVANYAVENRDTIADLLEDGQTKQAKKLLKGAPWSKRDDAADRGSAIHDALEAYLTGDPLPDGMSEEEYDCAVAAEVFLQEFVGQVLGAELTVYSWEHDYAGTLDLWCTDREGNRWIIDWKSSKDVYVSHAVQQVAYRCAQHAVVNKSEVDEDKWTGELIDWGPGRAEHLGIVHVTPERATLHRIRPDQQKRLWRVFRAAKFMKAWQSDTDDYHGEPDVRTYDEPRTFTPHQRSDPAAAAS